MLCSDAVAEQGVNTTQTEEGKEAFRTRFLWISSSSEGSGLGEKNGEERAVEVLRRRREALPPDRQT